MLSFEEKIMALASIRALGLTKAVQVIAKFKRTPPPTMREHLDDLDRTHYLLDDGFVVKTNTGVLQYVEFVCPQQPTVLTKEYFDKCKAPRQEAIMEALSCLGMTSLLRVFKPLPIVKKTRYAAQTATAS